MPAVVGAEASVSGACLTRGFVLGRLRTAGLRRRFPLGGRGGGNGSPPLSDMLFGRLWGLAATGLGHPAADLLLLSDSPTENKKCAKSKCINDNFIIVVIWIFEY